MKKLKKTHQFMVIFVMLLSSRLTFAASSVGTTRTQPITAQLCVQLLETPHYYEIPRIAETSPNHSPSEAQRANDFLETQSHPILPQSPPESNAMTRFSAEGEVRPILEGGGEHSAELLPGGQILVLRPSMTGKYGGGTFGGVRYNELPNSTLLQTVDPTTQKPRSFLISRGVRYYTTHVDLNNGTIAPQDYISDVLLFEIIDGVRFYRARLFSSSNDTKFLFEDPRISMLTFADKSQKILLSGTDYSPHVAGNPEPFVMNRFVQLTLDEHGEPLPVPVGADGKPHFSNLSPRPVRRVDGKGIAAVDAKNGTVTLNEFDQVVVRTRLRPDFTVPEIKALAGDKKWKYGEQVFVFANYEQFSKYNWDYCLEDLFRPGHAANRIAPILAKELIRDSDISEKFKDPRVLLEKGKGLGPGTTPVRMIRRGGAIYISTGKNAPEQFSGLVPDGCSLQDGEMTYISFDHEIRYFNDVRNGNAFTKRHYSLSVKQFDPTLTAITAYYADALQPVVRYERGYNSGIADLLHVYPMGYEIITKDGRAMIRVSLGSSDAHTEVILVDPVKLLTEMAPGSEGWRSGQVYRTRGYSTN